MFLFKKLLAPFLMPVPFCLALLLLGLVLLWLTRRQRAGKWLATLGALLLLLLGYGSVSGRLPASLDLDSISPDTETQAEVVRGRLGAAEFYLVTSASHMPRALALFRKAGTNPIPAPTHFLTQGDRSLAPSDFFPSSGGLRRAEAATYEYLGLAWAKVRGKI